VIFLDHLLATLSDGWTASPIVGSEIQETQLATRSCVTSPPSGRSETEHRDEELRVSGTAIAGIVAAFDGCEAPPLRPGKISGTTTATRVSPEIAESDDRNAATMEPTNGLGPWCSMSSLKITKMTMEGSLAMASDPPNDFSGIHLPLQARVKPRRLSSCHRDMLLGSIRTQTVRRNRSTGIESGRLSELSASDKHLGTGVCHFDCQRRCWTPNW
jgi:hypothetical protein